MNFLYVYNLYICIYIYVYLYIYIFFTQLFQCALYEHRVRNEFRTQKLKIFMYYLFYLTLFSNNNVFIRFSILILITISVSVISLYVFTFTRLLTNY